MEQKDIDIQKTPQIYRAIAGVIADVGYVAKDKPNKQQGWMYRSVDDVFNALHPALAKNKVFIVPRILERSCEVVGKTQKGATMVKVVCKIKFNFFAEDGSTVEAVIVGEGLDTGDKATNKAMAVAYKYACFQVFCIPTEEMSDPDAESLELDSLKQDKKEPAKKNGSKKTAEKPEAKKEAPDDIPENYAKGSDQATPEMIQTIRKEQKRTGVTDRQILGRQKVTGKSIETLTIDDFKYIMSIFEKTPDLRREDDKNE